jgi:hypothetical protein
MRREAKELISHGETKRFASAPLSIDFIDVGESTISPNRLFS